ncbi:cysteinyl-tRNA synthetase [Candidatus Moduliflexus flocculans]|uniref:Cysteine--tRNA ligase n=1 Tax=Candidatus Moduliflexus flocculans TaxID=1499966 RepID=A0A0S6W345_9BACT|nr:cysteinyl-tRNA synthetase [Candidatus Moduliflexus flocculans]
MGLQLYNTLSGQKEPFEPLTPGKARMYACGVTVYDYCHIGHARSAMVFDVIRNYLEYKGYEVTFVKNFTDVDDKIIKRSLTEGISTQAVAEKYIAAHHEDMRRLGLRPPTIEPKATEHIADMLEVIQTLVDRGLAYAVDGDPSTSSGQDVYYAVKKFHGYGKLSGRNVDDMRSGARVDVDERKHDPLDFALWKASKPGEPAWDSPWGKGRPGWHIECSAMARKYLGDTFDIHGGGQDLIFPHHENEIAQSEGCTGKLFAKYWLHNGMVNINSEKMSKSLGNFFTIRDVMAKYSPEAIRYLMLSVHYRSPLDYSDARLNEANAALKRFLNTFQDVAQLQARINSTNPISADTAERLKVFTAQMPEFKTAFEAAMDDDFNTAGAIGVLFEMVKAINAVVRVVAAQKDISAEMVEPLIMAVNGVKTLGGVLGLTFAQSEPGGSEHALVEQLMTLLLQLRKDARAAKNWAMADQIRNGLTALGIQVKDLPDGKSSWTIE